MKIDRALQIKGWMTEPELLWLAMQAESHKTIVEIGSYLGRSTRALAENTSGIVYAVDDWYGPRDVEIPEEERMQVLPQFLCNMDGLQEHVRVVTANHAEADLEVSPDMVFIDGDHSYASVVRDIERWNKSLAPGGLICGHDACQEDVNRAVISLLGTMRIVPNTSIWYYQ